VSDVSHGEMANDGKQKMKQQMTEPSSDDRQGWPQILGEIFYTGASILSRLNLGLS
jgi:hypothetical protein